MDGVRISRGFPQDRLEAYAAALDFVAFAETILARLPPRRWALANQLERAAMSVVLNIAEGCGEFSSKDKARFYRMALRSATECAAILDLALRKAIMTEIERANGRRLLDRVVALTTGLARAHQGRHAHPSPSRSLSPP